MDPITIGVIGIAAVSGIAQYYQSEKARGANQSELNKIKDLYQSLIPPNYDLSIDAPPKLHKNELALPKYADAMQSPNFALTKLTPNILKRVGNYVPQFAQYIAEQAPEMLTESADMVKGREAQIRALDRFKQIGSGEFDPQYQAMVMKAQRAAEQEAKSSNESILQSAARRGMQNSGLSMAMQGQAASQSMDRLAGSNLDAASQAYQNRLNALASGAELGGNIRSADLDMKSRNADIINSFNQRMQQGRQNVENARAGSINEARRYNLGEEQRISDLNAGTQNTYDQNHQKRLDDLTKYGYESRISERDRGDRVARQRYQDQVEKLTYNNNIEQTLADWYAKQRAMRNSMLSQGFSDQVSKAGGMAKPWGMQIDFNNQSAADRNQAIQGATNVLIGAGQSWSDSQKEDREWDRDRALATYNRTGVWPKT